MEVEKVVNTSKKNFIIGMLVCIVLLLSIASGYITYQYHDVKYWNNYIYPKVTVEGIDLSGKTKEEAVAALKYIFEEQLKNRKINIAASDKNYDIEYSKLSPKYNIEETVKEAYSYGKKVNLFSKYFLLKDPKPVNYKLKVIYNEGFVKEFIKTVENDINRDPVNATLNTDGVNFTVIPEQSGIKLESDKLQKEISEKVQQNGSGDIAIKASIKSTEAKIKGDMLKDINATIGSFTTNYGAISSPQRANNIVIATKSINGKVLMPGDVFSFNDVVGERTEKKGYEAAPVIVDNKLESGLGGGVCQVSSTLYNAVYSSGMSSLERTHHTLPVHYVPEGMDATVDYGNIDYKFKNNFKYPIYIQAYTSGGNVTFVLYSNVSARKQFK